MKLAVVGSRTFGDYQTLKSTIEKIEELEEETTLIVSGGARGADTLGERFADEYGIEKLIFPADWKTYGRRAGFIRNVDIIRNCDVCVCFWDMDSHGTRHDIELCIEHKKKCYVCNYLKKNVAVDESLKADNVIYI